MIQPMRIAWFSPLPPARSGIAAYSADLVPRLAPVHAIEGNAVDAVTLATSCRHKEPDAAHYGRENLEI